MTDAAPSVGRVFISYRRQETAYAAGWLFDRLVDRFGRGQIFKDVDSIQLGDDFVEVISTAVGSCDVLLALIGDQWLTIADEQGGARLDDPDDFVRLEIEAALTRNVRVIPILVEGARMPHADELPASLSKLTRRQALELSPSRFDFDTSRLLKVLDSTLAEVHSQPTVTEPVAPSGGAKPSVVASGAPSGDLAGLEQDRVRRKRQRVLTAAAAVVVAAGVIGALVLLSSDGSGDTDSTGRTVEIPATQAWTDTHVECRAGDVLDIAASGTILHDTVVREAVTPDGFDDPVYHQFNVPGLPEANFAALIGSISREQPYFVVGKQTTYECPGAGGLFLGINDVGLANNGGEFIATIKQRHGN
jgi:TIR domain